jgi:nucleoside-diphosphate-sugar epimerase
VDAVVTGAGGFLGRYIVEQLVARGDRVCGICRTPSPALESLGVRIVAADLRDREAIVAACRGAEVVFHVAGVAGIWGPWQHFYAINTLGTAHVLEGCRVHGVGRLVYTSSPSVVFDGRDQHRVDASAPYPKRWLCHYPHSKALAEQAVLAANGHQRLATCAVRPHLIWGPRDRQLIPRLLQRARAGRLRRVGDGTNRIDMVYVENAAAAHLQAADALLGRNGVHPSDSPVAGQAYFISQGEPVNCWEWIDQILALAGIPPLRKSMPTRVAWALGAACEALYAGLRLRSEPPMTRFLAAQLGRCHYFDISPAERDFGYQPRISTAEGMRRLAQELASPGQP